MNRTECLSATKMLCMHLKRFFLHSLRLSEITCINKGSMKCILKKEAYLIEQSKTIYYYAE